MRNGLKRLAIAAATALICYALLGFLILPGLAQRIANQQLAVYASVPASLARMEFNPFSLELDVFAQPSNTTSASITCMSISPGTACSGAPCT